MRPFQEGELFLIAQWCVLIKADGAPLQGAAAGEAHLDQEILATAARSIPLDGFHQERGRPGHSGYRWSRIASANEIRLSRREGALGGASCPADVADAKLRQYLGQGQKLLVRG